MPLDTNFTASTTNPAEKVNATNVAVNRLTDGTGWRDITSLLINGWVADRVWLIRRGNRVILKFSNLNGTAATGSTIIATATLAGFRPAADTHVTAWSNATPYAVFVGFSSGSGGITSAARVSFGSQEQEFIWECSSTWPTSLPGTAVA
jgi:hypothetical protein